MSKVILICGKICSGKSYYARQLQQESNAVILSTDEATYDLIRNEQGEFYNMFARRVNGYLQKKAVEIVRAGADVILDWGFWTAHDRTEITEFFAARQISWEWHYIDVEETLWHQHIETRNRKVCSGNGGSDFYVDEGLLNKLLSLFEPPSREDIDVWYELTEDSPHPMD